MNDDLTTLASAYLDGDVTADERAQVDGNPELTAEVERLRLVQALLADVENPPISIREQHLAAALSAWDRLPATERSGANRDATPSGIDPAAAAVAASISTPPPTSLASRRRKSSTGWILGAAAAVAVVMGGGIILQSQSNEDDSSASIDDSTLETLSADEPTSSSALANEAADEFQRDANGALADAAEIAEAPAAVVEGEGDFDIDAETPPQNADLEMLSNPEQLGIFASDARGLRSSTETAATNSVNDAPSSEEGSTIAEFPICGSVDYVVGPADYMGEPVIVGIDESRNMAFAHRAIGCSEVARAGMP